MRTFQLDQCLDSKRFARECTAQGLCRTARLPPSLRDADDPELLEALMVAQNPLVTFDRALPCDHIASIPAQHPGILVIIEITTSDVEVWHVDVHRLVRDTYLGFDSTDWQSRLTSVLQRNSQLDSASSPAPSA